MKKQPAKKTAAEPAKKRKAREDKGQPAFIVTDEMLRRAAERPGQRGLPGGANHPFTIAPPPPGTLPDGKKAMAMDSSVNDVLAWAVNSVGSALGEGLGFLGYAYLSELAQRPEYRRISERIATEMTRKWIELKGEATDDNDKDKEKARAAKIKTINASMKKLKVRDLFRGAALHDGFFGRGHIYIGTGKDTDLAELKTSIGTGSDDASRAKMGKGKLKRLKLIEPIWVYPANYNSNDPTAEDWYKPIIWYVQGKEIHHTRLLTFVGREVPDLLKPAYSFGGLSLSQMAKPYVDNWLKTRQSVAEIIQAFSVFVLATDLGSTLKTGGDQLFKRLDLFNLLRNNRGILATNKNTEDFKNIAAPLGTLDVLQAQTQEHMAAVSGIPLVILLGIQPAGLNASSEGEIRTFYDWIEAYQELLFSTHLKTIIDFIQLSEFGEIDPSIVFSWKTLWTADPKILADIQKTKADTHAIYVDMGAVDKMEVRAAVAADPDSPYHSINVEEVPDMDEEEETDLETTAPNAGKQEEGAAHA